MRITAGILLGVWLLLVLLGKGGFVHTLLLTGIAFVFIDILSVYRATIRK